MKKAIGVIICCCLLESCSTPRRAYQAPRPGTAYPYQDLAPLPWVRVIPSERVTTLKEVDFNIISEQLRNDMIFPPQSARLTNVSLVLIDYGMATDKDLREKDIQLFFKGESYSPKYQNKPERYIMKMTFYNCDKRPPELPYFEETIFMEKKKAPPQEAMRLMAHTIIEDFRVSCLRKLVVSLD